MLLVAAGLGATLSAPAATAGETGPPGDPARAAQVAAETLAEVAGEPITVDQLRAELARRLERGAPPPRQEAEVAALLEAMVRQRALLAAARAAGYDQRPELIEVWERLVVQAYLRDALEQRLDRLEVSDAEVAAHYAAHAADYAIPGRRQVAIVFYQAGEADAAARSAARDRAAAARAEAAGLAVKHFGDLARRDSDHRESRYQGGVVGYLVDPPAGADPERLAGLPAEVIAAAARLEKPGELAPVVATAGGFYLVRLAARDAARAQPLEQVAAGIRHQLLRAKRDATSAAFEQESRAAAGVRVDAGRLRDLDLPYVPPAPPPLPVQAAGAQPGDSP